MIILDVKLLAGQMPTKGTEDSAAYDLYSPIGMLLTPESFQVLDLGIQIALPAGTCGVISHRSGMNARCGIFAYGLIDSDYRGNLKVALFNFSNDPYCIKKGERVAQLKVEQIPHVVIRQVLKLSETSRGGGHHGSTGS